MGYLVKITPQAKQDLEDIAYFIALDSQNSARTFIKELVKSVHNTLSTLPESGTIYKGDVRKIAYKGYTAFYQVNHEMQQVNILHIVNLTQPLSVRDLSF